MESIASSLIRTVIGLGNPGPKFKQNRHNIGFRVVDELAKRYNGSWQKKDHMEIAEISIDGKKIFLVKPLTFMNESGKVIPYLQKQGIKPEQILVVHDELEKPYGSLSFKDGGSARGHNGLRSIINMIGQEFKRLRFGIGRPEKKEEVPNYVLKDFEENIPELETLIEEACDMIVTLL